MYKIFLLFEMLFILSTYTDFQHNDRIKNTTYVYRNINIFCVYNNNLKTVKYSIQILIVNKTFYILKHTSGE